MPVISVSVRGYCPFRAVSRSISRLVLKIPDVSRQPRHGALHLLNSPFGEYATLCISSDLGKAKDASASLSAIIVYRDN